LPSIDPGREEEVEEKKISRNQRNRNLKESKWLFHVTKIAAYAPMSRLEPSFWP
jgi:hypothetical protein